MIEVVSIDGEGGTLGRAGPCMYVNSLGNLLPKIGVMQLDIADVAKLERKGSLTRVVAHELGHVLGIGVLWKRYNYIKGSSTDPVYTGKRSILHTFIDSKVSQQVTAQFRDTTILEELVISLRLRMQVVLELLIAIVSFYSQICRRRINFLGKGEHQNSAPSL